MFKYPNVFDYIEHNITAGMMIYRYCNHENVPNRGNVVLKNCSVPSERHI